MQLMFVYGTLKRNYGNNRLLSGANYMGTAITKDATYEMRSWGGFPAVYDNGNTRITGEIYSVPNSMIPRIDSLEGHPDWYCRHKRQVILNTGKELTAWIYIMPVSEKTESRSIVSSGIWE